MVKEGKIRIIGIGTSGCMIVNYIYRENYSEVDFWAIDSDLDQLGKIQIKQKIYLNLERVKNIEDVLKRKMKGLGGIPGTMVVMGLGGKTGSVILSSVIQTVKRKKSNLIVFTTFPARMEGPVRRRRAEMLLEELRLKTVWLHLIRVEDYIEKWSKLTVSDFIEEINHVVAEDVKNNIKNLVAELDTM